MSIFRANWHILIALIFVTPQIQYGALPIKHQLNYQNKFLKMFYQCVKPSCSITCIFMFLPGRSKKVVELVSLFSTLAELAGLQVPPACPETSFHVALCTEGASIVWYFNASEEKVEEEKVVCDDTYRCFNEEPVAFSQYPRPADTPQWNSDKPKLKDIRIMGYSMRTIDYRYTVWVQFNPNNFSANFEDVHAGELYVVETDPNQDYNIYNNTSHGWLFKKILGFLKH